MIVVLSIMGVVSMTAAQIMSVSFKMQREARLHDALVYRVDNAIDRIRRDVWAAKAVRATDATLELDGPDGTITWTTSPDGLLKRTRAGIDDKLAGQWKDMPIFHFSAPVSGKGAALVKVSVISGERGKKADEMTFVSAPLVTGGGS
jgi:hypothetical protein